MARKIKIGDKEYTKEQIKAGGKINKQSKYNIGSVKENAPTILSSITNKTNLSFDSDALEDPNSIESLYVTNIYNRMQTQANRLYNAGAEIPSNNQLALDAIDYVNNQFLFQNKEPGMFGKILGFIGFGDDEQKTELAGVKTSGSGTGQKVTNQMIDTLAKANNLPRDQIIALLKAQRPDLDFSGIS